MVLLGGCAYVTGEAVKTPAPAMETINKNVSPAEASALIQANQGKPDFTVIDVRTPAEHAAGYIDSARNIDLNSGNFREEINKLDRNGIYLLYCLTGMRSAAARDIMLELGFNRLYNLTGGFSGWKSAGLPVVQ